MIALKEAVEANPSGWRAWNALAGEWDSRRDWTQSEAAYGKALTLSKGAAQVLNNRGYSRMLQGRLDEAVTDLVAALAKDPGMAAARTNLRLAMAMRGEYDQALAGAASDGQPAALNNAGFAAMMRGDYDRAVALFEQAMQSKGEYYARASANLQMARGLKAQGARAAAQ
jgi:Flp pilus assembly protein TadD